MIEEDLHDTHPGPVPLRDRLKPCPLGLAMIGEGTPCVHCGTGAIPCQHIFRDSDQRRWCCEGCRHDGARLAHTKGTDHVET